MRSEFDIPDLKINSLHGASTPEQAEKELKFFFPMEQTVALIKPGLAAEKKSNLVYIFLYKVVLLIEIIYINRGN